MDNEKQTWYFVTFVTHNSRISERMIYYNTNDFIKNLKPYLFNYENRILITTLIIAQCKKHNILITALNVLPDHVHIVLAGTSEEDINNKIGLIKGCSSFFYNRKLKIDKNKTHVWAQKFYIEYYETEEHFLNILNYIKNNHIKHSVTWGKQLIEEYNNGLKNLIENACIDYRDLHKQ